MVASFVFYVDLHSRLPPPPRAIDLKLYANIKDTLRIPQREKITEEGKELQWIDKKIKKMFRDISKQSKSVSSNIEVNTWYNGGAKEDVEKS